MDIWCVTSIHVTFRRQQDDFCLIIDNFCHIFQGGFVGLHHCCGTVWMHPLDMVFNSKGNLLWETTVTAWVRLPVEVTDQVILEVTHWPKGHFAFYALEVLRTMLTFHMSCNMEKESTLKTRTYLQALQLFSYLDRGLLWRRVCRIFYRWRQTSSRV